MTLDAQDLQPAGWRLVMAGEQSQVQRITLAPTPSAAPLSSMFVASVLSDWRMESLVGDAQAVVTELVTNAVRASALAGTDMTVQLRKEQGSLYIEVGDRVEALPLLRRPSLKDDRGLGLSFVASLSKRWGTRQEGGGKVVWSELSSL